jgi:ring-1,2-phenylacetyl-CoA epoxidase subunit PaaE
MQQLEYKKLLISEVRQETDEIKLIYFVEASSRSIQFKAGQYLTFIFDKPGKESRRSYSIASSPAIHEPLFIGIKRIPNGNFSRLLFDYAKPGDVLVTPGAAGVFTLPDNISNYRQIFFFAAGSGIIPILSLIKTILHLHPFVKIVLVYSNKSLALTAFYRELNQLQAQFPGNLHIEFLFSNTEDLFRARLHADLVSVFLESLAIDSLDKCLYYTCGPEAYMRFCTFILHGYHIPAENIKKEIFYTARPAARIEPPDKSAYRVFVTKGDKEYDIEVQYPTTILQAARKNEIDISYSCEVGRCGNCVATCTSGKVWMSYNEVLTERELAKGLILTCTGYPVGGDVSIRVE